MASQEGCWLPWMSPISSGISSFGSGLLEKSEEVKEPEPAFSEPEPSPPAPKIGSGGWPAEFIKSGHPHRCYLWDPHAPKYPVSEDFNLEELMKKYSKKREPLNTLEELMKKYSKDRDESVFNFTEFASSLQPKESVKERPKPKTSEHVKVQLESKSSNAGVRLGDERWQSPSKSSSARNKSHCLFPNKTDKTASATAASPCSSGSSGSSTITGHNKASNREDAVDFARRYGGEDSLKPTLYYRMRRGKYRKEF